MRELGAISGACMLLVALCAASDDGVVRRAVPSDSLPVPLDRSVKLGAEELAEVDTASPEQVALGRRLFFEARLSKDASVACASCHQPVLAFADDRALSLGIDSQATRFNAPSLFNKGLSENLLWDGRAATLEAQVLLPIENPAEMGLGIPAALKFVAGNRDYAQAFVDAFGGRPTEERLAKALASFLRALVIADSPVDRFRAGEVSELSPEEQAGLWIYEGRGGCWRCHHGPNFSDEAFHNTGVGLEDGVLRPGRAEVTGELTDSGKFRTPGLRMLTKTAPYMHDGSFETLEEVVEFYRSGGRSNAYLSEKIRPLELSDRDVANLVAFLQALSR